MSFQGHEVLNDISFVVNPGEFLTILGPSGCGKTTLLRLIAGFETPSTGQILIQGKNAATIDVQHRPVNTVFQNYALFPHMTVYHNVAFGLQCKGIHPQTIRARVERMLERVHMSGFEHRMPEQLSGGQRQRIAMARAAINEPSVLLLDEPLGALDYRLRKILQLELKELQRELGIAFVLVTHDQEEALSLSDRIIVIEAGRIEQIGTPREIYEEPATVAVAKFIGELNIFDGVVEKVNQEHLTTTIEGNSVTLVNKKGFNQGDRIHITIRPEDIVVHRTKEAIHTQFQLPCTIGQVIYKGSTVDLICKTKSGQKVSVTQFFNEDDEDLEYTMGEKVWLDWYSGWEVILPHEKQ